MSARDRGGGALAAVALLTFAFQLPFFDRWINFMDEGHLLQFADVIASGGQLYGDATVYPLPATFYALAALFKVFQPSILLSRWIVTLQFTLFVTLCFAFVRRLVPTGWAFGLVLFLLAYRVWAFPHWQMYSYSTTALLVFLICAFPLARFFESDEPRWLAVAGLIFGIGVACKQDYGAAALVTFSLALAVYARSTTGRRSTVPRIFATFLAPAGAVGLCLGAYFLAHGLLGDMLRFTVFNHFIGMATYEYMSFPSLWPLFGQDAGLRSIVGISSHMPAILVTIDWKTVSESFLYRETAVIDSVLKLFYFGPYALLAYGGARLARRREEVNDDALRGRYYRELLLYGFALGLVLLISLNRPQDYVHMAVLYWPILCLATMYLSDARRAHPQFVLAIILVLALPIGAWGGYTVKLAWQLHEIHDTHFDLPRARIYTTAEQARTIGELVSYMEVNSAPDDPVGVLPYSPLLNFLADRRGPHRAAYILWPFPELEDRDRRIVDAMEEHSMNLLVLDFVYFHDFPRMRDYAPELFAYLVENFRMMKVFSSEEAWPKKFGLALREPETTEGVALDPGAPGAGVVVEAPDRPPLPIPPEKRHEYVSLDLWPLRPVMAVRPSAGGRETVVSIPIDVPFGAELKTSVGIKPVLWDKHPPSWVRFTLSIRRGEDRQTVFTKTLDSTNVVADRGWFEATVPLHAFAGQSIVLEFSTATQRERAENLFMGGWGVPRLVTPDDDGDTSTSNSHAETAKDPA